MSLDSFLLQLRQSPESISFNAAMETISQHYQYTPTRFTNGEGDDCVVNEAGTNEGSCKLFAFGELHRLTEDEMLQCFGDYYRVDVLQHPDASDHANIRNFMKYGWPGIHFDQAALTPA